LERPVHYRIRIVFIRAIDSFFAHMIFERVYHVFLQLLPCYEAVELTLPISAYFVFLDIAVFIGNPYRMKLRMTELQIESDYLTEGTQHFVAHESFIQTEPIGKLYGRLSLVDNPGMVRTGQRPTRQRPVVELDTNQCILIIVVQKLKL